MNSGPRFFFRGACPSVGVRVCAGPCGCSGPWSCGCCEGFWLFRYLPNRSRSSEAWARNGQVAPALLVWVAMALPCPSKSPTTTCRLTQTLHFRGCEQPKRCAGCLPSDRRNDRSGNGGRLGASIARKRGVWGHWRDVVVTNHVGPTGNESFLEPPRHQGSQGTPKFFILKTAEEAKGRFVGASRNRQRSPLTRGSQIERRGPRLDDRSIPAHAGEPSDR